MRIHSLSIASAITTYFLAIIAMLFASTAFAQQHVSITIPGQNIKYLVSQNVEVGDVPNHIVRVFDIRDTVPANVTINGSKIVEVSVRGIANGYGGGDAAYTAFVAENGDKFFSRSHVSAQPFSGKLRATWAGTITTGTGKFAGIQGTMRMIAEFDPIANTNGNTQIDIDYTVAQRASGGTAQEARAMLEKAVAAVKADRDVALAMFNKGEGGFLQGDLYPFCYRMTDGKAVAGGVTANGADLRTALHVVERYRLIDYAAAIEVQQRGLRTHAFLVGWGRNSRWTGHRPQL
jgi:hypothetical protein